MTEFPNSINDVTVSEMTDFSLNVAFPLTSKRVFALALSPFFMLTLETVDFESSFKFSWPMIVSIGFPDF